MKLRIADCGLRIWGPPLPPRGESGGEPPIRNPKSAIRNSERGVALLFALALLVLVGILLNAAAVFSGRVTREVRRRQVEETALLEARGGVRAVGARLMRGDVPGPPVLTDAAGVLRIAVEGDRIRVTRERAEGVVRSASARWRRGPAPELFEWEEE